MDAKLAKLLLLRLHGGMRERVLELKSLRGLLFLLITIAVIALLMSPSALPGNPMANVLTNDSETLRKQIPQYMPVGLLAGFLLTVLTSSGPAIYFSPSEINLLFSGPFTRRSLVLYKLSFYALGALLSSLLIILLAPKFSYSLMAAFLGTFLTLVFLQLFNAATGLVVQWLGRYFYMPIKRRYVYMVLIALLAASAWYFAGNSNGVDGALTLFQSSTVGTLLLAPFNVFVQIFIAQSIFPGLLGWATLGLAMNVGLLGIIILLDGRFHEASTAASLEMHKRWERASRGGLLWSVQAGVVRSSMRPPMLNGIGPVAWRQLLSAFRSSGKTLFVFLGMAIAAGPILVTAGGEISKWSLMGSLFVAGVFVLPRTIVFDFRSDLENMESLKALPLAPWKICFGQLASPVLLTCLIELVLLVSAAFFVDTGLRFLLICMSPFLIPFNMLLYEIENLFFLLFPARLVPVGRADFDFLGRTLVGYGVTCTFLIVSCGLAVIAGQLALKATGWPWPVFVVAAWFSLALIAFLTLPLLSWAFGRFDVCRG